MTVLGSAGDAEEEEGVGDVALELDHVPILLCKVQIRSEEIWHYTTNCFSNSLDLSNKLTSVNLLKWYWWREH